MKNLYLSKEFAPGIVAALQELVGDRITEVLPSLQNIFVVGLEPLGPFQEDIGRFVAARRLSGHPIASSDWDKDSNTSRSTSLPHYCTSTVAAAQISATSTSTVRTNANAHSSPGPPTAPLNVSPLLDSHSVYPPVSHRAGQQLVSSVYRDAGSERTGSLQTSQRALTPTKKKKKTHPERMIRWRCLPIGIGMPPAGPPNPTTLSATTQPGAGSKSDPD